MAAAVQTEPTPAATTSSDDNNDIIHVVHCAATAYCGVTEIGRMYPPGDYGARDCVVCADLEADGHCPVCGWA